VSKLGVVEDAVEDAQQGLPGLAALLGQGSVFGSGMLADYSRICRTPFIGVRTSWLMLARKRDLAAVGFLGG
jgi:hypothetical protein